MKFFCLFFVFGLVTRANGLPYVYARGDDEEDLARFYMHPNYNLHYLYEWIGRLIERGNYAERLNEDELGDLAPLASADQHHQVFHHASEMDGDRFNYYNRNNV